MDFLVNELSFHGQFHTTAEFFNAVERLMEIRRVIQREGSELLCHRCLASVQVTPQSTMQQAIQSMQLEKRRVWMQWLTKVGPFWVNDRQHAPDDWLEVANGDIVTDRAIGEAAFCLTHGLKRDLVSADPSNWLLDPLVVTWSRIDGIHQKVNVKNHWTVESVSQTLAALPRPFDSWHSMQDYARRAFPRLVFADNAFEPLRGHPYAPSAAERIVMRLNVLHRLRGCFDAEGNRTQEGEQLYEMYFTGGKPWFTDSSDPEKNDFRRDLTFQHPDSPGNYLFCTWHGKVRTPQIRIHFSWPITATEPTYIVYVGPKITVR